MSAVRRIKLDEKLRVLFGGLVEVFGVEHEDVVLLRNLSVLVILGDHDRNEGGDCQEYP